MDVVKYIFMTIIVSLALIGLGFWIENPLPIVVGMGIFVLVGIFLVWDAKNTPQ